MTSEKIRELHKAQPFHSFVLHMADGRHINVRHPEQMAISPSGRIAVVFTADDQKDSSHYIDVLMITDIEVKSDRPSNGKHRRRSA
jgi:hypothetical protein